MPWFCLWMSRCRYLFPGACSSGLAAHSTPRYFSVGSAGELFAVTSPWPFAEGYAERVINRVRRVLLFCFAVSVHGRITETGGVQ